MKTTPLPEILKQITPLPWPLTGPVRGTSEPLSVPDVFYARHAVNHLLEVTKRLGVLIEVLDNSPEAVARRGFLTTDHDLHRELTAAKHAYTQATQINLP